MIKDKFSNTSTVPMATMAISDLMNKKVQVTDFEKQGEMIIYTIILDGRQETIAQFSKENEQFLNEIQLPAEVILRWDGWRHTLVGV